MMKSPILSLTNVIKKGHISATFLRGLEPPVIERGHHITEVYNDILFPKTFEDSIELVVPALL